MLHRCLGLTRTRGIRMKFRKPLKITSRTSSITNSFVQAIIPSIEPSEEERREALRVLEIDPENSTCAYCGDRSTDWDHLYPFVRDKRPTGYINELKNLVPSCGRCNQSKSGADWRRWIESGAAGSPKTRRVTDLKERIARLERFEARSNLKPLRLEELAGAELWEKHWRNLEEIEEKMRQAQEHAEKVKERIQDALSEDMSL